jgi:hypothetical protein
MRPAAWKLLCEEADKFSKGDLAVTGCSFRGMSHDDRAVFRVDGYKTALVESEDKGLFAGEMEERRIEDWFYVWLPSWAALAEHQIV